MCENKILGTVPFIFSKELIKFQASEYCGSCEPLSLKN
jgi:hypothetical protein